MTTTAAAPVAVRAGAAGREARPGLVRTNAGRALGLLLALAVLVLVLAASLAVGAKSVPLPDVWSALTAPDGSEHAFIVRELRVPRALLALTAGAALGVSGALIQALTRNPLADPGILGVNAGAGFAVTIGVGFLGLSSITAYLWLSFAGAILVTALVYVIGSAGQGGGTPIRLTLVGVAIGAVLAGISSAITLLKPDAFVKLVGWSAGSLAGRDWNILFTVLPFIGAGLLLALLVARPLNAVALGDDLARSLGADIVRTRLLVILSVTLLAGAATAAAGPIGFVGLMVPHVARWFIGPDQRWIIPYTAICSPLLLIVADVLGRVVLSPQELQAGIVTAFVGAPVLILLVRRKKVSGL
ncbi:MULTISPECIES: iron chelate uptake ABC transporter family permease subunit [Streptomyces]|uniref:iron chelate uptake ABC transporter family permease subunit n=1 Tax=Streptomyces TaxID=1883 RepID=UPI0010C23252|nr:MULTISPECIES: iron chelate uptake ABC transporter family permease subunit [unclassified Streptomyces]MBV7246793.1 iron chelate uptake ABC transporter family permease subunit [Streptomyces sp. MW-W600-10]